MLGEYDFVNPLVAMSTHVMSTCSEICLSRSTATQRNATQFPSESKLRWDMGNMLQLCIALGGMGFIPNDSCLVCAGQQADAIRLLHQRVPQKKKKKKHPISKKITSSSAKPTKPETPIHRLVAVECVTVGNFFRTPFFRQT